MFLFAQFFVFLMVILVAEISGGVWAYMNRAELHKMVRETVQNTVQKEYTKDNVTTTTFDMIQQSLKCCGSRDYKSWLGSVFHPGRMDIGVTNQNQNISHVVPESCCVEPGTPDCKRARQDVKDDDHYHKVIYTEVIHSNTSFIDSNEIIMYDYLHNYRAAHRNWRTCWKTISITF